MMKIFLIRNDPLPPGQGTLVKPSRGHLLAYHFREISSKSPDRFIISSKRAIASAATHP
jgi:hypothetical protein